MWQAIHQLRFTTTYSRLRLQVATLHHKHLGPVLTVSEKRIYTETKRKHKNLVCIRVFFVQDVDHSDWHMDGLTVRIKDSYPHDPDLCRAEGVIRSIHVSNPYNISK